MVWRSHIVSGPDPCLFVMIIDIKSPPNCHVVNRILSLLTTRLRLAREITQTFKLQGMHSLQLWFMPSWLTHLFFRLIMTHGRGLEAEIISPLPILCRYVYRRLLKAWAYLTGISESFLDHTSLIAIHTKWVTIWSKDLALARRLRGGRSKKNFSVFYTIITIS